MNDTQSLPQAFLEKLHLLFPETRDYDRVLASFSKRKPSTFRVNTLKTTQEALLSALAQLGIHVDTVSWNTIAFILKNVEQKVLTATDYYTQGELYVQSLSSMIPPLVLDPQKGDKVLDLCAAPGSKTTQMAAMMENTGEIIANDSSRIRNFRLKANLAVQGVTNTTIVMMPGEFLWKQSPQYFDKTLVDVPCSMEGRFYTEDPKSYADWSPKKVKELSQKQKFLIRSAVSATKVGGTIVYSTCTLSPEENEEVVDWILEKEQGCLEVEKVSIPSLTDAMPGLTSFGKRNYNPDLVKTLRVSPSETMEGFYVAKLKKVKSTVIPDF